MKKNITLKVNGQPYSLEVDAKDLLLHVIRERIGLTGTKEGCGTGECGACTVLLDGTPINSCLYLAIKAEGKEILTIEGSWRTISLASVAAGVHRQCCRPVRLLRARHVAVGQGAAG